METTETARRSPVVLHVTHETPREQHDADRASQETDRQHDHRHAQLEGRRPSGRIRRRRPPRGRESARSSRSIDVRGRSVVSPWRLSRARRALARAVNAIPCGTLVKASFGVDAEARAMSCDRSRSSTDRRWPNAMRPQRSARCMWGSCDGLPRVTAASWLTPLSLSRLDRFNSPSDRPAYSRSRRANASRSPASGCAHRAPDAVRRYYASQSPASSPRSGMRGWRPW